MGTKMKGIYKGFKHSLSQIFVKDREIEIGYPTDVKHVAHIGWDGPSGSAPSWMNEFRTGPDFAAASIGNSGSALSPWSSQDYGESARQPSEASSEMFKDMSKETPTVKKKHRRKNKLKSTSSPKSVSGSTSRSSRAAISPNPSLLVKTILNQQTLKLYKNYTIFFKVLFLVLCMDKKGIWMV